MKSQYQMALVLILRSLLQVNLQKQPTKIWDDWIYFIFSLFIYLD
jgi:hypothetical protein